MEAYNLVSFAGIFILVAAAWALSENRSRVSWRIAAWGLGLQMVFALFVFIIPAGTRIFLVINDLAVKILGSASAGSEFLFGVLAKPPGTEGSLGFFLAFQALPAIIFFSALTAILYHFNILPCIIRVFARVFTRLMRISGAESLCAASNIFVGIESALTVKPHLHGMTRSELCTLLTAGMATVASNVLALYIFTLQGQFPTIAGHLISASVLSAPAALVMSKLLVPETGAPETLGKDISPHYEKESGVFEAVIKGSRGGVQLITGIAALLVAVLGLVALVNLVTGGLGGQINSLTGWQVDWTLQGLIGYLFYPVALVTGIPPADALTAGKIIGERLIVTEVPAYRHLAAALADGSLKHPRSAVIITYALCGFAHLASMAIFIGGISALVPERTKDLARVGFRALLAATLACLLTACIAGTFYTQSSILLGR